jgi:hypothetical protein
MAAAWAAAPAGVEAVAPAVGVVGQVAVAAAEEAVVAVADADNQATISFPPAHWEPGRYGSNISFLEITFEPIARPSLRTRLLFLPRRLGRRHHGGCMTEYGTIDHCRDCL